MQKAMGDENAKTKTQKQMMMRMQKGDENA
jgi:hypothetical protein